MAFTQAQLDSIKTAYARGVLEATLPDGSKVRYRSLSEMRQVITDIETELGLHSTRTNVAYPTHKRGFE